MYERKESQAYISKNLTTKPNTPGRFIVWFRNETTLLTLWQPPYPAGFYTDYKVSIDPEDANVSETYVPKGGEPPGPAQWAFNGLFPGRAYNISVQTVSEGQFSDPITVKYRTVPLKPHNITFNPNTIDTNYFSLKWSAPSRVSEFDRYKVNIGIEIDTEGILVPMGTPQIILRSEPLVARFTEDLMPGRTYLVDVMTVSGDVVSWPAIGNVTTRPLPVRNLRSFNDYNDPVTSDIKLFWEGHPDSQQDQYKITYSELEKINGDISTVFVEDPFFNMKNLQSGRNYSIEVQAVSDNMESLGKKTYQAIPPRTTFIKVVKQL